MYLYQLFEICHKAKLFGYCSLFCIFFFFAFFYKGKSFWLPICFPGGQSPSKMGSTLKGSKFFFLRIAPRQTAVCEIWYRKNSKNWDTLNYHHDCPANGIVGFYSAILRSKDADRITNRVDTDQTAPWGAVWSGSALFAQTYLSQYFKLLRYHCWWRKPLSVFWFESIQTGETPHLRNFCFTF